jgi:hypothetical protein
MNRLLPGQFQPRPAPQPEELVQLKASLAERIPDLLEQLARATAGEKPSTTGDPLSSECRRVLEYASRKADRMRHQKITGSTQAGTKSIVH